MSPKIALIFSIFLAVSLGFSGQIHGSVGSGDYVIFRAIISPLYIENESVIIQVLAVPFQDNKPVGETCTVYVKISGLNTNYNYSQQYTVHSGRAETLYLPALKEGHYDMNLYAAWNGLPSRNVDQDFGVTKPPVPYSLSFSEDGSYIRFKSLKLNSTGVPDPDYPFKLEIYEYVHGSGESLITTYKDITNITIYVPENWRAGILYVEVIDCWGWRNSATINLAQMQFQGIPLSYDYHYTQREPFASRMPYYIIISLILLVLAIWAIRRWFNE